MRKNSEGVVIMKGSFLLVVAWERNDLQIGGVR